MNRLGSPFWIRACWTLKTYFSGWRGVGLGLGLVLSLVVSVVAIAMREKEPKYVAAYPAPDESFRAGFVGSKHALDEARVRGEESFVDTVNFMRLYAELGLPRSRPAKPEEQLLNPPDESHFKILDEFPNVRFLLDPDTFGGDMSTLASHLTKLEQLEYLRLSNSSTLLKEIAATGGPPKLHCVDFFGGCDPKQIQALAGMPNIDTVILRNCLIPNFAEELAKLPQLHTLVIDSPLDESLKPVYEQAFAALSKAKTLQTIYLGGRVADSALIQVIADHALPNVSFYPCVYRTLNFGNNNPTFGLSGVHFFYFGWIMVTLSMQFASPSSHVLPGFMKPHLTAAGVLLGWVILCITTLLVMLQSRVVPALLWPTFAVAVFVAMLGREFAKHRTSENVSMIARVLMVFLMIGIALPFSPRGQDLLYTGFHPGVWCGLALATAFALRHAYLNLQQLAGTGYSEKLRPLGGNIAWKNAAAAGTYPLRSAKLASLNAKLRSLSWLRQACLWRLGTAPPLTTYLIVISVCIGGFQLVPPYFMHQRISAETIKIALNMTFFALGMYTLSMTVINWWARLSCMSLEWTRPLPNRTIRKQWLVGFIYDLALAATAVTMLVGVTLCVAQIFVAFKMPLSLPPAVIALPLAWLGTFLFGLFAGLLMFTFSSPLLGTLLTLLLLIYYGIALPLMVGSFSLVNLDLRNPSHFLLLLPGLALVILFVSLAAVPVMLAALYWRWMHREFDPRGR